jgi:hypothetical protein
MLQGFLTFGADFELLLSKHINDTDRRIGAKSRAEIL